MCLCNLCTFASPHLNCKNSNLETDISSHIFTKFKIILTLAKVVGLVTVESNIFIIFRHIPLNLPAINIEKDYFVGQPKSSRRKVHTVYEPSS